MRFCGFLVTFVVMAVASAKAQSVDSLVVQTAVIKLKNAQEYTLRVADLMPEASYAFKPTPDEMSFGEQLLHLSANMGWLSSSFLTGTGENPVSKSDSKLQGKAEIRAVVVRAYAYALSALQRFEPARLSEPVTFFAGPMNKLQIITLLNDHQTHHRAQLLIYLRLKGLTPPQYVGW